jgi:hypothetical protein
LWRYAWASLIERRAEAHEPFDEQEVRCAAAHLQPGLIALGFSD